MPAPQFKYLSTQNWATDIVATLAAGTAFIPLGDCPADEVTIFNPASGVSLDVLGGGQTDPTKFVTIDAPSGTTFPVSGSIAEVQVRRTDKSATPVTVRFSWRKFRR